MFYSVVQLKALEAKYFLDRDKQHMIQALQKKDQYLGLPQDLHGEHLNRMNSIVYETRTQLVP